MLVPLFDLTQQFNNKNGAVLVGGRLYVYYVGRSELVTTWADEDGTAQNTNPVLLDNNGRAPVFVDNSYSYTLVVCDRNGAELFSQDITPGSVGGSGTGTVYHDETLTGDGTQTNLLGANAFPLAVDETLTAYTGVADNKDALILGVNGDWFSANYLDKFNDKVDLSAFNSACSAWDNNLSSKVDWSAMSGYYTKGETDTMLSSYVKSSALSNTLQNFYNKSQTNTLLNQKQDKLTFAYDSDSAISSINGSALRGDSSSNPFPMTGTDGYATYEANMDCSSISLTTGAGLRWLGVDLYPTGVHYGVNDYEVSASWNKILTAVNNKSNTYCINFSLTSTAVNLEDYSAFNKLTIVHGSMPTTPCNVYWKNQTKVYSVPSAFYVEMVKTSNASGTADWFFTNSGSINNYSWSDN